MEDWHAILGVAKACSLDEIKSAYRKKALEFHPDRNPSPEAKSQFIKIDTAYRVLSDSSFKPNPAPPPKPKPAPKPKKSPEPYFKDSMAGQYGTRYQEPNTFKDSAQYYQAPAPPPRRRQPPKPDEPEPKLWWGHKSSMDGYWKEYNRLKNSCAYEDPDVFWDKLDEWVKDNHK
jgi:hypothetical protein